MCAFLFCTFSNQSISAGHAESPSQDNLYNFDIDLDGNVDALTDGLLMLRYAFGLNGDDLTNSTIASGSPLTPSEVEVRLELLTAIADIDGNNQVDALTDGLLLLRYLFDLTEEALVSSAVSITATRSSATQITDYINSYMPGQAPLDSDNDGVSDNLDVFPNNPDEAYDSDGDGVGDNADAFPNDANGNGIGDNADAANISGPQSDYCDTTLYHLNFENESSSAVNLTVENVGNEQLSIAITSTDSNAVDNLTIQSKTGANVTDDNSAGAGELAKTLSWSGAAPATETFTILWSKVTMGGDWIVRDISVPTDAVCGSGNNNTNAGSIPDDSGSNTPNPDDSATTPSETDANVLSIFSDEYLDISGVNFDPNWGQATSVSISNGEINYQNLNYQGTTFGGPRDVSGYEYFHIDINPQQSGSLQLYLINSNAVTGIGPIETYVDLSLIANQWNSFDIPLASFTSVVNLTAVDEIKIVGSGAMALDNLYFGGGSTNDTGSGSGDDSSSNTPNSDGSAPAPSESDADVLSIFSDEYTDISGVNFDPNWGQATSVTVSNGEINYQNLNYQGTTFGGPRDVSGYGYFHIDINPQQSGSLQLYLINSGAVTGNGPIETYYDLNLTANQWNSFDIPLASFTSVVDLTKVDEIKIVGSGAMSLDNLYFGGESTNDNGGNDDFYQGDDAVPTEEIAVADGYLVGGVNSSKPQFVVYVFDSDPIAGGVSSCYGGCASAWPPVYVEDDSPSGVSNLSSITRSDGTEQVTYEGRPLYFYAGDQQPGDRTGDTVSGWHSIEYGNIGQVNKLYNDSTPLEPVSSFVREDGVIVTRIADRGRDRHAKDSGFQDHYDHYLGHYWQFRTMRIQLEDYVPKGQSLIKVTWITESALDAKEFRVWYGGLNTSGQFWFNPQPLGQQANTAESAVVSHGSGTWNNDFQRVGPGSQYKYTLNIVDRWTLTGPSGPLQTGMKMEFEASMFLANPPAGIRLRYYGTSFVYVIGEPGVHPFEWQTGQQDGTPIPQKGLSGGYTTLGYNYTNEPAGRFMQMATNMSPGNAEPFVRGRRVHHTSFVNGVHGERSDNPVWTQQAGKASTHYINESCAGCHVRNGRALVADVGDSLERWVFKVGDANGEPLSSIGSVLQPQKIGSGSSEGNVILGAWTELSNGLRSPNYQFSNGTPPQFSARIAPSLVGMGLLEAIDESTIISWADENDANNDGISGRPSLVEDPASGVTRLGRFGYKAGTFSVKHQIASAFNTDMGVMTSMLPNPDCGSQQTNCGNSGAEISDQHVDDLVKYVSLLGVGARRNYNNQTGEALFQSIGCAGCHRPSVVTSNHHPLAELRGQTIYPYTDLLLHDMGPGLADNLAEGSASGSEWRTAPLWGLGLTKNVMLGDLKGNDLISIADAQNRTANMQRIGYLHDGRARTIDEAIRWHGGEALNAKNAYEALLPGQRSAVIDFLESL